MCSPLSEVELRTHATYGAPDRLVIDVGHQARSEERQGSPAEVEARDPDAAKSEGRQHPLQLNPAVVSATDFIDLEANHVASGDFHDLIGDCDALSLDKVTSVDRAAERSVLIDFLTPRKLVNKALSGSR